MVLATNLAIYDISPLLGMSSISSGSIHRDFCLTAAASKCFLARICALSKFACNSSTYVPIHISPLLLGFGKIKSVGNLTSRPSISMFAENPVDSLGVLRHAAAIQLRFLSHLFC